MAQLDALIGALVQHGAEALLLEPEQRPALLIQGARRPIVKQPLAADRIAALVAEIRPAGTAANRFDYAAPSGTVAVEVRGGNTVEIRAAAAAGAATATPGGAGDAGATPDPAPEGDRFRVTGPLSMETLFTALVQGRGSDLHLSSGARPMVRCDGDLMPMPGTAEVEASTVERLLLEIAPDRNRDEFNTGGDTDFAHELGAVARIRCNFFRDRKGPGGVFRVIPSKILSAEQLSLPKAICDLAQLHKGLVLVTGPTGSGKSTTLAALIDRINATRADHIITIEDPIEFVHPNRKCLVNQREVALHTAGFKTALRAALREDPDVVLVGELRDLETIHIALETAETGHLVFGTLHTSSAVSTIDRVIDQFPAGQQSQIRIMLSESLKAVVAQTLCKKIGGGRVAALEVLMINAAVSNLIREGKTFQIQSMMQTGRKIGNVQLNDSLVELVKTKQVEAHEAYLKSLDKSALLTMFKHARIPAKFLDEPAEPALA